MSTVPTQKAPLPFLGHWAGPGDWLQINIHPFEIEVAFSAGHTGHPAEALMIRGDIGEEVLHCSSREGLLLFKVQADPTDPDHINVWSISSGDATPREERFGRIPSCPWKDYKLVKVKK